jgi:hypothetical protein
VTDRPIFNYAAALERTAAAAEASGDFVRASELRERAKHQANLSPPTGPIGPVASLVAGERPRSEAEAMLDRAMSILEDIRADIAHPHASRTPSDDTLLSRIDALRDQVRAFKVATP